MNSYLEKLHANQIHFPSDHENLMRNLFYLADRLKDEEDIALSVKWEQDTNGHKEVAYRAVIKPKVLLAQLDRYCAE